MPGRDAKTAVAELTDRPALEKALAGVQSVFVVTGHNRSMVEQQNNVPDAALEAGTQYLVRVGGSRPLAKADSESMVGRGHAAIEKRLQASGIKWVILCPGPVHAERAGLGGLDQDRQQDGAALRQGLACGVDRRARHRRGRRRILIDPAPHAGKTYEFTGKLTNLRCLRRGVLAGTLPAHRLCRHTPEQAEQGLKARRMPDWLVAHLVTSAKLGAAGAFSTENIKLIEDLVGRAPITTKQFVEDFKALFS